MVADAFLVSDRARVGRKLIAQVSFRDHLGQACSPFQLSLSGLPLPSLTAVGRLPTLAVSVICFSSNNAEPAARFHREELLPAPSYRSVSVQRSKKHNKGTRMSTAQLVVQHLPYLRRYARALTGSQMAGDAYVAATLETLVSEPETIGQRATSRSSSSGSSPASGIPCRSTARASRSSAICRRKCASARSRRCPRQAFLLSCLEGFSEEEVGRDPRRRRRRRFANSSTRPGANSPPTWRPTS